MPTYKLSDLPDSFFVKPDEKAFLADTCSIVLPDEPEALAELLDLKISCLIPPRLCSAKIRIGNINKKAKLRLCISESTIDIGNGVSGHWFIASWQKSTICIGDETNANNGVGIAVKLLAEPNSIATIGSDCMFSDGITLQCGGQHSIISIAEREIISQGISKLHVCDHVWVGRDSTLVASSKETEVGDGSIIATRAVVTKSTPNICVVAGNPGRVVKQGVTWCRQFRAMQEEIDRVCNKLAEPES